MEDLLKLLGDVEAQSLPVDVLETCGRLRGQLEALRPPPLRELNAPRAKRPAQPSKPASPKRSRRLKSPVVSLEPIPTPAPTSKKRSSKRDSKSESVTPTKIDDKTSDAAKKQPVKEDTTMKTAPVYISDDVPNEEESVNVAEKQTDDKINDAIKKPTTNTKVPSQRAKKPAPAVVKSKKSAVRELTVTVDKLENVSIDESFNVSMSSTTSTISRISKISRRNRKGETPLHLACVTSKYETVRKLLDENANPNTKDNAGWTPLHEVVSSGSMSIVRILLEHGALPFVPGPMNETPLHEAVKTKAVEMIKLLMNHGADYNARNWNGLTPYDIADDKIKQLLKSYKNYKIEEKFPSFLSLFKTRLTSDIKIYPVSLTESRTKLLTDLLVDHKNLTIEKTLNKDVTFVLFETDDNDNCYMTPDTLSAVLLGIPIINSKWLDKCSSSELSLLDAFQLNNLGGYRDGVWLSYINRCKFFPPIFDGCHFYFRAFKKGIEISSSLVVSKEMLSKFIIEGGGVVLKREPNPELIPPSEQIIPFHAPIDSELQICSHFIVYGEKPNLTYNMKHIKSLPVTWLIESIQNFYLVDPF